MRVPLSWLRDYVDVQLDPEKLAERLTLLGMQVKGIERWGADWRNVQRFETDFPEAQVVLLEQNYRSTQTILDVAQAIVRRQIPRLLELHPRVLETDIADAAARTGRRRARNGDAAVRRDPPRGRPRVARPTAVRC